MGGEILVDLLMGLFLEGVWQGEGKKVSHHFTLDAVVCDCLLKMNAM